MPSISNIPKEYTEADQAQWILENGHPHFIWIFERDGEQIYRRPMAEPGTELPPWVSTEREPLDNKGLVKVIKEGKKI